MGYLPIQYKCHFLQFSTFCFLLSYHEKILLTTKIKSGILVIEQKTMFPSWTGIKKYINLNRKKNKNQKQKKNIIPILVLKQKTKHTHLKRCLNYNHLPQPLEICSPQKNYKKKPS